MEEKSKYSEQQLVRNLSRGNLLAFNTLYKEYSHRLFHFANGYLKSEAEAEELVQEVFTRIWEKRAELKEEYSFKSFLFTIAFNIIRRHFRTRSYLEEYFRGSTLDESDTGTSQQVSYDSLHQYIEELVEQLPEKRKDIFIKSRFEGLTVKEIADILEISHKTVENQLTDALRFIRSNLNRESIPLLLFFFLFLS